MYNNTAPSNSENDHLFEQFCEDLNDLHYRCRMFHKKWHNITSEITVTPEQATMLQAIWDQHEAWYSDNKE